MENKYSHYEELGDFLAGTFHQDIESPEEALNEFIMEVTKICIENTKNDILLFLNSNLTDSEKEEFIKFGGEKCIDCGLCSFVCPSNIEIAQTIKTAKTFK